MTDKEQILTLNKQLDRGVGLVNAMTLEIDGLRQENTETRKELGQVLEENRRLRRKYIGTKNELDSEQLENYHLREALEFYANEQLYYGSPKWKVFEDTGDKARRALEGKQ